MFQNGEVLSEERFNIISMKAKVDFEVDKFLKDQKAEVACQICKSTGKVATYRGKITDQFTSLTTHSILRNAEKRTNAAVRYMFRQRQNIRLVFQYRLFC